MLAQLGRVAALAAVIGAPTAASAGGHGDRYGAYQTSGYQSQSYSASTRIEEEAHGVTGVIGGDGRAYVTGGYHGGYASGGGYQATSQDGYARQGGYHQEAYGAPPFADAGYEGPAYEHDAYERQGGAGRAYASQGIGGTYYDGPTYAPPPPYAEGRYSATPYSNPGYGGGYSHDGYVSARPAVYAPPAPDCPPGAGHGGERVLRCVYVSRPREVRLNDSFFYGGGVGPGYIAGGGGGGMVVVGGGFASAGSRASGYARASASASASAHVSVSGGGRSRGGGCNCGGKSR